MQTKGSLAQEAFPKTPLFGKVPQTKDNKNTDLRQPHPPAPSLIFGKVTAQAPQPGGAHPGIPDRDGGRKADEAARNTGRHGHRDATLILIAYRHALRVAELVALRWEQIDLSQGFLHVVRRKHGVDCSHPLRGPEIRALRQLQRD
jgi:integrase